MESKERRQNTYTRQYRTYGKGCKYTLDLGNSAGDRKKDQRTSGRADFLCVGGPLHHDVRPKRTKTFRSKSTLSSTYFYSCIFLSAFHLHWVTAYEISAPNPQDRHVSPFEHQQMTDKQLHNISPIQLSSLGQSTRNPGITCQNSSRTQEIDMKMRRELRSAHLQGRNALFYTTQQAVHHNKLDPSKLSQSVVRNPGWNYNAFRATYINSLPKNQHEI